MSDDDPPTDGPTPSDRLLLDTMLGSLARHLRMCGYDAAYALDRDVEADDAVLSLAREEDRTVITRDRQLAERADDAYLLTEREVDEQLRELVAAGFDLSLADPPARCGRCNGPLERASDGDDRPEYVPSDDRPVRRCRDCGQWFWKGSHWDDVRDRLRRL